MRNVFKHSLIQLLIFFSLSFADDSYCMLAKAIKNNEVKMLDQFLKTGKSLNFFVNGYSLAHILAFYGRYEMLKLILKYRYFKPEIVDTVAYKVPKAISKVDNPQFVGFSISIKKFNSYKEMFNTLQRLSNTLREKIFIYISDKGTYSLRYGFYSSKREAYKGFVEILYNNFITDEIDSYGNRPIDIARKRGFSKIVELLSRTK